MKNTKKLLLLVIIPAMLIFMPFTVFGSSDFFDSDGGGLDLTPTTSTSDLLNTPSTSIGTSNTLVTDNKPNPTTGDINTSVLLIATIAVAGGLVFVVKKYKTTLE